GDVDMYKFTALANQEYAIDASPGTLSQLIRIFDGDGNVLMSGEETQYFTPTQAGTYYIGVSDSFNESYDPVTGGNDYPFSSFTGPYTLSVTPTPPDLDDQISEAATITPGNAKAGELTPGDVDMFKFTATAGQRFVIAGEQGSADTWLRVFDDTGTQV